MVRTNDPKNDPQQANGPQLIGGLGGANPDRAAVEVVLSTFYLLMVASIHGAAILVILCGGKLFLRSLLPGSQSWNFKLL